MPLFVWARQNFFFRNLLGRRDHLANATRGPAELTTKWNIFITRIRSDSHFSPLWGQRALMQQASHNGPRCSAYIIKSPLTVACPAESRRAPEWNHCMYNHFPHFSHTHYTSRLEFPRNLRYSYKTMFYYMSSTSHTNQEHQHSGSN